ncbi:hypothetical protein PC116_g18614 [Phytophthora cactorum]|uniref:Uncharacterized protein n=1 Tax=Phytophthora cactorum TaxID=29920 RepID=A0A329RX02_9STRA|nr:hypothetical protein PC114_g14580 [Phytophthora cactorum]KAG4233183.1 hypothetical protein PC116_g18614 [Phytophthora cactorum]RAW29115.1 hypothetical protein PC110_g14514 [Phytophthora cactorum]
MDIFSGRLRSRGLTIMHFKGCSEMAYLEDGSTSLNFSSDFSPSAVLPAVGIDCASYDDILGLSARERGKLADLPSNLLLAGHCACLPAFSYRRL